MKINLKKPQKTNKNQNTTQQTHTLNKQTQTNKENPHQTKTAVVFTE